MTSSLPKLGTRYLQPLCLPNLMLSKRWSKEVPHEPQPPNPKNSQPRGCPRPQAHAPDESFRCQRFCLEEANAPEKVLTQYRHGRIAASSNGPVCAILHG